MDGFSLNSFKALQLVLLLAKLAEGRIELEKTQIWPQKDKEDREKEERPKLFINIEE